MFYTTIDQGTDIAQQLIDNQHEELHDTLAAYAMVAVLGKDAEAAYPVVAAHLEQCVVCSSELRELMELTRVAYTGEVQVARVYPQPKLDFLQLQHAPEQNTARPWSVDALGRLVVQFSQPLLELLRQKSLAGAMRGQQLYHYVQESGSLQDVNVTIDVFAENAVRGPGHVRVVVEVFSLSPLDQGGSRVIVRAGDDVWQGETDETGSVDFAPVPLDIIPVMRVEIDPRRE